jgi:cellulose synthase/poly-beta-1,6-N-acetylglucosamine synthase-like glycosyltransferase
VARKFNRCGPQVVCLQGALDYYNPRSNWIARCITIEYASWIRIVLPGLARLGLVLPLGGTTLFIRRDALERLGRWDAHNVTEDADLGVRICRAGLRTEMVRTTTYEEANCRPWPWIKQRSRWLKGFMMTYLVHMRSPRRLLINLGWKRFIGFNAFFLGTAGQFLLAPFLWSFWLLLLGFGHPGQAYFPAWLLLMMLGVQILYEATSAIIGTFAALRSRRPWLLAWIPTMPLYFPLGAAAGYKALYELMRRPFFWDKTQHGQAGEDPAPARSPVNCRAGPRPASDGS